MKKLAIVTTHPIQYNAPLYALLHGRGNILIKVFYTWGDTVSSEKYDPGFGKSIAWDVPLLEGYPFVFEKNIALDPGSHHFKGIDNPQLAGNILEWKADAILLYGWSFKSHLKLLRYFHRKIPLLFRGDSTLVMEPALLKNMLRTAFLKWVYNKVDFALYVGSHNKKYFEAWGLQEQQLLFAPHAIDNDRFMNPDEGLNERAALKRTELGINADAIVFLYAGKLDYNKNVQLLLDVFIELNNVDIHLVIAGNGVTEISLKGNASGKKNIHFLPFQNQQYMPVLYRVGDVMVLPSLTETWGLSVNEAMASGRAVLISDSCGAARDLLREGENGYVFASGSKISLLTKMQQILRHKNLLADWGKKSREIIKDWNYVATCEGIESLVNMNTTI